MMTNARELHARALELEANVLDQCAREIQAHRGLGFCCSHPDDARRWSERAAMLRRHAASARQPAPLCTHCGEEPAIRTAPQLCRACEVLCE